MSVVFPSQRMPGGTAGQPPTAPPGGGFTPTRGRVQPYAHLSKGPPHV